MLDKMMRISGRGKSGTAEAIKTNNGNLETISSNRRLIKDFTSNRHTTNIDAFFGDNAGLYGNTKSLDVSNYSDISILISNQYPQAITLRIAAYPDNHVGYSESIDTLHAGRVEPGETIYLTGVEVEKLNIPYSSIMISSNIVDGLAPSGSMNVKVFGSNSTANFDSTKTEVIYTRRTVTNLDSVLLKAPSWAKSCTIGCIIHGVTGTDANFSFWTRAGFIKNTSYSNLSMRLGNDDQINTAKIVYHIWGEGVSYGDLDDTRTDLLLAGINPQPNVLFEPLIEGTFSAGQGVDLEVFAIWKR